MIDLFDTPAQITGPAGGELQRDRWGRPLVVPPGGDKPIPYTRCTSYVSALEDQNGLALWKQRQVALGLAARSDLVLAAAAHHDDREKLNEICQAAMEAAGSHTAAETGTALHKLLERADLGQDLGPVPDAYRADIVAYQQATRLFEPVAVEQFLVLDDLRIGGTPDRIVRYQGRCYIADIKTGQITHSAGKIAMQLAVYSRSQLYDPDTYERRPLPDVDQRNGIVIHLPAGQGRCELHWFNLAAGWEAVQLATQVRAWRARKDLSQPLVIPSAVTA